MATRDDPSRTVGDYVSLVRGTTYKGDLVGAPGPALLGLGSIEPGGGFRIADYKTYGGECPDELMLFPGDIYASLKGATKDGKMIGSVARVPPSVQSGRLTQDTVKLVFREPNPTDAPYIYWILRTPQYRDYCAGRATGSAVVALSRSDFLSYSVPPPTPLRRKLVALFDEIEEKIELNRRMSETLEAMARALFKSWFVDFDPVHAKVQGRNPDLPKSIADLFPDSFEDSRLGQVPKGWGTQLAAEILTLDKGLSYKGAFLSDAGVPLVNLGCFLGRGRFNEKALKYYTGEFQSRHTVKPGDLLLANTDITQKREVLGSPGIVPTVSGTDVLLFTHHLFAVRLNPGKDALKMFVYFTLLGDEFRERAAGFATGTTVLALPRDAVLGLTLPRPPDELIHTFNATAQPLLRRRWANVQESRTLADVRDGLLPKLITSQLRIPDLSAW